MTQGTTITGIALRDLTIAYGDSDPVIDIPELELPAGSYTLVTGPTGCGKSTLALALVGLAGEMLDATVSGSIRVAGRDPAELDQAERAALVGAVWQRPEAQLFRRTLLEEVQAGLDFQRIPALDGAERARAALGQVGLSHLDEQRDPLALSGGEQQRLSLAGVLALDPHLLVLDEAFSQLDAPGRNRFTEAIVTLRARRPVTVVAFDHRPDPHLGAADRVIVLDRDGRVALDGAPAQVYSREGEQCRQIGVRIPARTTSSRTTRPARAVQTAGSPALRIDSLDITRGRAPVLRNVGLDLPQGAVAILTGPNGAGKSTLLAAIAGSVGPARDTITPPRRRRLRAGIGYAPQRGSELMLASSVQDELRLASPPGTSPSDEELGRLLDEAGLTELTDHHPQRLSGGQRQRLATLLAVAGRPKLLLLDEPTNAQDAHGLERIRALISHHANERVAIVATHEPDELDGIATHRLALHKGRLTEESLR
ncbi:MAG: ATP-binding cassette domain-containing protein [Microbacteriaceae bacterium]